MAWFVYLIECRDGSIYTGIAVDVAARFAAHAAGKGARYTRSHPPRRLLAEFEHADRSSATIAEHRIKQLSALQKRALCHKPAPKHRSPATVAEAHGVEPVSSAKRRAKDAGRRKPGNGLRRPP